MKTCCRCKLEQSLEFFGKNIRNSDGHQYACMNCSQVYSKNWYKKNLNKNRKMRRDSINKRRTHSDIRYYRSKSEAKRHGKVWTLPKEEYKFIIEKECFYCNGLFGKSKVGVGLDRIDNSKGYESNNVLPCCGHCNRTRGDRFSVFETKHLILKIIELRNLKI